MDNLITGYTPIDGFKMVEDMHYLYGLSERELPLELNRDWHPDIHKLYKKALLGELFLGRNPSTEYTTNFFIYQRDPIDDWEGYFQIFLEDMVHEKKWRNFIYHTFKILNENSNWEKDIRSGPYISMLPGYEMPFSHWVVLLKQENNGDTFIVSRYRLDYLHKYLVCYNEGRTVNI